jgi:hypothetical protein
MDVIVLINIVEHNNLIYQSTVVISIKSIFRVYELNQSNIKLLPPMLSLLILG